MRHSLLHLLTADARVLPAAATVFIQVRALMACNVQHVVVEMYSQEKVHVQCSREHKCACTLAADLSLLQHMRSSFIQKHRLRRCALRPRREWTWVRWTATAGTTPTCQVHSIEVLYCNG